MIGNKKEADKMLKRIRNYSKQRKKKILKNILLSLKKKHYFDKNLFKYISDKILELG